MQGQDSAPQWSGTMPLAVGIAALVLLIGCLGVWSVVARISGAVVTSGMIEVESNRQVVQHPNGGVVGAILVGESELVKQGDVLIRLDGRQLLSELSVVEGQLHETAARKARLKAERDQSIELKYPDDLVLLAESDPEIDRLLKGEKTLFEARNEALLQETNLLREQNNQIHKRIEGIAAQLGALEVQNELIGKEVFDQRELLGKQLAQASRVNELLRTEAELTGQTGRLKAETAELRGQLAANEISLLQLSTRRREEAVSQLRDLEYREIELVERKLDLADTLSRLEIRAPMGGLVYDLQVFAEQSVIRAAEPILYIIPQGQPLVVSVRVETISVNDVFVGQEVSLRFPAFDQRQTPEISGVVTQISADVIKDEVTGMNYYAAKIMPYESELSKLGDGRLLPGMPVEAFIQTNERSPLAYLVEPMTGFFRRAFRE